MDIFDKLRQNWFCYLTGENNQSSIYKEAIDNINAKAKYALENMNRNADGLWADCSSTTLSDHITIGYRHIESMALSYSTNNSIYYKNADILYDIVYALEWYNQHRYNQNSAYYGNWWHWEIGTPQALCNTIVLIYDALSTEQIEKYVRAIKSFVPDPRYNRRGKNISTGANRTDLAKISILCGVITKGYNCIVSGVKAVNEALVYVTNGEGFYRDGSFIQHKNIPYNGSYGMVLIEGISELMYMLRGGEWQFDNAQINIICEWICNAYLPILHKGRAMDFVRGRAVSRSFLEEHVAGHSIIQSIANIAIVLRDSNLCKQSVVNMILSTVKHLLNQDTYLSYYKCARLHYIKILDGIVRNDDIKPVDIAPKHYQFSMMDRVVHRTAKYAFCVSMYSDRIQNYEDMLDENKKAWHTSDGCTYIYNDDLSCYSDGYWATVNPYRLSGTTIDAKELPVIPASDGTGFQTTSGSSWVGGCHIKGLYGCAGMELDTPFSSLTCKKSWFMLQNYIVCLGSDINSDRQNHIETIIENRKIDRTYNFEILNDRKLYLKGDSVDKSIGYVILDSAIPNVVRETRSGSWHDINWSMSTAEVRNQFITIYIDHGANPQNQGYAYAILPCVKPFEIDSKLSAMVLRQDKYAHAIFDKSLCLTAINFWQNTFVRCGNISCYQKASVMMIETLNDYKINISAPTMPDLYNQGSNTVVVELLGQATKVITKDERISCKIFEGKAAIEVDVRNLYGQPVGIVISKN